MIGVLLSGGSGKRLWPLYGETRSRQFLKVLKNKEGIKESMIMRVKRQLESIIPIVDIYITAVDAQRDAIRRQLDMEEHLITEPFRKGTFSAVLLSGAGIIEKRHPDPGEILLMVPVDPYADGDYFGAAVKLSAALSKSGASVGLMGIKPTYPSEKYGYIQGAMEPGEDYGRVETYLEKPDSQRAEELISRGARWNGGVFAFRVSFIQELIKTYIPDADMEHPLKAVQEAYNELPAISFDRQVLETHQDMVYIPYDGEWKDLGTWNTLTEKMDEPDGGLVFRGEGCIDTHVINELEIPVVALGLKNAVVVASADGILVSDKHASSFMEPYVEKLNVRPMYEKRQWGEYRVLDICKCSSSPETSLTKRLYVEAGRSLSCQRHFLRSEIWTIIDGSGYFLLNGERRRVKRGEVLYIEKGDWHSMASVTGIEFIEVQLGTELIEEDIERAPYDWSDVLPRG